MNRRPRNNARPPHWLIGLGALFSLVLSACGYHLSSSPYQLQEPLVIQVPLAQNKTTMVDLAPKLTSLVVEALSTAPQVTVVPPGSPVAVPGAGQGTLRLTITRLVVEGGAWEVEQWDQASSVSRRVIITVTGLLSRTSAEGQPLPEVIRSVTTDRTYQVASDHTQLEINQTYAADLALAEASRKLVLNLFSDF